ncbi:MAG: hypothetical protein K2Z81_28110 [Cyanobacteria bacterium]|nr:hypothetical protein [Cyanobacteriota bacterium]
MLHHFVESCKFKFNRRLSRAAFLSLAFCLASSLPALAEVEDPERQFVLEGLDGVHVSVPAITNMSIDRSDIAKAVEERLKSSGMKVIGEQEYLNFTDVKSLVVRLTPIQHGGKTFFSLNLDLTQMIYLPDKDSRKVDVSMWDDDSVGLVDSNKEGQIKEDVLKRVDKFIGMWRRSNGDDGTKKPN